MDGVSMAYTWDKANANVPSRRTTQYFEMLGNRAIYHDGWVAATTPVTIPWELSTKPPPDVITGYNWELYNVTDDLTEDNDLAAQNAGQAQANAGPLLLRGEEVRRAAARQLDAGPLEHAASEPDGGAHGLHLFGPIASVPASGAPNILNKSYTITAEVKIPKGGAEGMIVTEGGRFGGYGLFLSHGVQLVGQRRTWSGIWAWDCWHSDCLLVMARAEQQHGHA